MKNALMLTGLLFISLAAAAQSTPNKPEAKPQPKVALETLKKGGYAIVFRHASRNDITMKPDPVEVVDNRRGCLDGSELNEQGIKESKAIGSTIRKMKIPVQEIYFSPVCRIDQMIKLMNLKKVKTHETRALTYARMWSEAEKKTVPKDFINLISKKPAAGKNIIYLAHKDTFRPDEIGFDPNLKMGDAAVIKPLGDGKIEYVGVILVGDWNK